MDEIRCPMCGKSNQKGQDYCQFCGARLTPMVAPNPPDTKPIKAGDQPSRKEDNLESRKQVAGEHVQAGEAPTDKNASELEPTLPSWLRSLRESQETSEDGIEVEVHGEQELPFDSTSTSEAGKSPKQTDWLLGLEKAASDEETEAPDWLARLRNDQDASTIPESSPPREPRTTSTEGKAIQPEEPGLSAQKEENIPIQSPLEAQPGWLNPQEENEIEGKPAGLEYEESFASSNLPEWLSKIGQSTDKPDSDISDANHAPDTVNPEGGAEDKAASPIFNKEQPTSTEAQDGLPSWLSQLHEDLDKVEEQKAKQEQFELDNESPTKKSETEELPDWLKGVKPTSTSPNEMPALIMHDEGMASEEQDKAAFSMNIPDWLAKLRPDQELKKTAEEDTNETEDLEVSELPAWVQAMRPVESVVNDVKASSQDALKIEQSGPLAGMEGVLPATPGLGTLRKPPIYSTMLQVNDNQQRYADTFDHLIACETQTQSSKKTKMASTQLWRWLIACLLILAVGFPLLLKIQATPTSKLRPPEMVNAFTLISNLPANAPILLVFDYDPALSGELEAAATPLMNHLLLQGPRLTMISTNPTGPALAERFFHDTNASPLVASHNYQAELQYVNLGYLAGGSSGVLYFAISPEQAAPLTIDGKPAWQMAPLQGIHKLSDFATIIILSDNADDGRIMLEQVGLTIGSTPIVMVISAQAEPMMLPYYDSGQIKGLVTGLAGGEAYGQTSIASDGQAGLLQRYWNSFGIGTLMAEVLIVVGSLVSVFSGLRYLRRKPA